MCTDFLIAESVTHVCLDFNVCVCLNPSDCMFILLNADSAVCVHIF
jgi:hypothetical protein